MKKPVSFKTLHGHLFLYSPFRNQVLLCHPIIQHLFDLDGTGKDLKDYISSFRANQTPIFIGTLRFEYQELAYQWKKYRFLKRNRFFKVPRNINLNGRLLPSRIASNLAKIQQVIFETTEACNLSCSYCIYSRFYINKPRGKREFNITDAKRALEHLLAVRDKDSKELIISFYGGEPLKNIRFIKEIVTFLNTSHGDKFSFKFTMSSNGLLLSRHADFLAANNFRVSVSLDGDEPGNSFRLLPNNKSSHAAVIKNLDYIRERYPEYFDKNISFLTVLHNRNSFSGVHDYIKKRYGKVTLTSLISTNGISEDNKEEFTKIFLNGMQNDFRENGTMQELFMKHPTVKDLANTLEKYTGIVFKNHFQVMTRVNGNEGTKEFVPTATCLPFSMRVFLAADGAILPCEHISRNFELGRLRDNEIQLDHESIAGLFNQCFDKIRSMCEQCFLADNCKECVFNTRIETDRPVCDFFQDEQTFKKYLSGNFNLIGQDLSLYTRLLKEGFNEQ